MTRDAFIVAVDAEIDRIVFLASKLTPADMEFKLAPGSRTTAELLQYLTIAGAAIGDMFLTGNNTYGDYVEAAKKVTLDDFAEAMETQRAQIKKLVGAATDDAWHNGDATLPWKAERKTCDAMVESTLAFLIGYRMQLFLHLKANGHDDFTTWECWGAMDNPKRVGAAS